MKIVVAILASLISGCGTFNNSIAIFYYRPPEDPPVDYRTPNYVYGGVKFDALAARAVFEKDNDLLGRFLCLLLAADLPVSAVFDTIELYRTIPATRRVADDWRMSQELKWADFDDDGNILPRNDPATSPDASSEQ